MSNIFERIREIVSHIPKGKVATYGDIAKLAGTKDSRIVGWAMRGNQNPKVPCQRVIQAKGTLAENYSLGGWQEQQRRLEDDGVEFIDDRKLDLPKYRWQPQK